MPMKDKRLVAPVEGTKGGSTNTCSSSESCLADGLLRHPSPEPPPRAGQNSRGAPGSHSSAGGPRPCEKDRRTSRWWRPALEGGGGTGQPQQVPERPLCLPRTQQVCWKGPFLLADETGVWFLPARVLSSGSRVRRDGGGRTGLSPQQSPLPPGEPGARPPARAEADQTLQLFRGGRAHGVFGAGQRL